MQLTTVMSVISKRLFHRQKQSDSAATTTTGAKAEITPQQFARDVDNANKPRGGIIRLPQGALDASTHNARPATPPNHHFSRSRDTRHPSGDHQRSLFDPRAPPTGKPSAAVPPRKRGESESSYELRHAGFSFSGDWADLADEDVDSLYLDNLPGQRGSPFDGPKFFPRDDVDQRKRDQAQREHLRELERLEHEFDNILSRGNSDETKVKEFRNRIKFRYEKLILNDLKAAAEHNYEQNLWKTVFYQFIEARRRDYDENPQDKRALDRLLELIDEGNVCFEGLISELQYQV